MTEIVHAGRTETSKVVAFDIRWDGDLSGSDSVVWSVFVTSADGQEAVELGYRVENGAFAGQYVHDHNSARRHDVDEDADLLEREITVRFPTDRVGVAVEWPTWRAVITVDGTEVAEHLLALT